MILGEDNQKMSKSRGNVVNPDDIVAAYGADSMRVYEMFMGPLEVSKPWSTAGLIGVSRFLERAWAVSESHLSRTGLCRMGRAGCADKTSRVDETSSSGLVCKSAWWSRLSNSKAPAQDDKESDP